MRSRAILLALVAVAGCSKKSSKPEPAPATTGSAAAPTAPAPSSTASTTAAPAVAVPAVMTFAAGTPELELRDFCVANVDKMSSCFADPAFWDVMSTLFFAQNLSLDDGTAEKRDAWIGMRKDDLAALQREHRQAEDCEAAIKHNVWPTADAKAKVVAARGQSCASFANAYGKMLFVDHAFSDRRPDVKD